MMAIPSSVSSRSVNAFLRRTSLRGQQNLPWRAHIPGIEEPKAGDHDPHQGNAREDPCTESQSAIVLRSVSPRRREPVPVRRLGSPSTHARSTARAGGSDRETVEARKAAKSARRGGTARRDRKEVEHSGTYMSPGLYATTVPSGRVAMRSVPALLMSYVEARGAMTVPSAAASTLELTPVSWP